ncbi:membrane metallo-endopeptidase-like 1 [Leptopilina heterotoma]|uniref:membrane metallo-endopeptidase-like 1 n=1 Tax=Leptopilina heterotoma TaxID=63436 RepID=UPI001CA889AF|nr:membrane metallo-endopeptidase-like 1 [Leptopilina heterotoma]
MKLFILLSCTIIFVSGRSSNWDIFHIPFRQNSLKTYFHFNYEERKAETKKDYSVCRSQDCFKVASEFWESMNKSVDPCDDFYEYACGNWVKNNAIPPAEMKWNTIRKMTKEVEYKIRDFLEEELNANDLLPIKQVKKFYKSCMNDDELEKTGLKPLEAIISRNGGWPLPSEKFLTGPISVQYWEPRDRSSVLAISHWVIMESGEWFEENISWQQVDDIYSRLTGSSFYSFDITKDKRKIESFQDFKIINSSIIELKLPELPPVIALEDGMKFDRKKIYDDGSYGKFIKEIALVFIEERNAHVSEETLDEDIEDLINFEKKLGAESKINHLTPLFTPLEYFSKMCNTEEGESEFLSKPQLNLTKSFKNLLFEANIELSGENEFSVIPKVKMYLDNLCEILKETKPRTIVNYIHWNFLSKMLPHTTSKIREFFYEFKKHLTGVKIQKPRWETCIVNIQMQHAMAYYFVKKYFKESMKNDGVEMLRTIQKAMIKQILKSDWLSENAKKIELEKIKNIGTIFGYPNWYNNDVAFTNYYRGMPIGHQYLDNILVYKIYLLKKKLRKLGNYEIDLEWFPTIVNAAYNTLYHELFLPASLFQYPFYSPTQPETINFGSLGTIMGHEIAHAFDGSGILFDKNGNPVDWSEEDGMELEKNAMCFFTQYGKFYQIDEDDSLMGGREKTLDEDMADSLGVDIVFEAFEEMEKEKNEPRLPGFEKIWCTSATPEYEELVGKEDVHSPSRYRVITTVQNSEGFSKAFNCPKESPMNPKEKCRLWKK